MMRKFGVDRVPVVFLWCLAALSVAWANHGLPSLTALVYRGYGPGPTSVTLHPGKMMETSDRQPFVVGVVMVVMVVMVVNESLHVLPSNTPAVNARRVARSTREVAALVYSSSSRPSPQLLWQVLIVLSTCSSTTFDSLATVCTSSCASSRCLNSCSPVCTSGQLHLRTFSRRPKLVFGHRTNLIELAHHRRSSARAACSSHVHAVGSRTAPSPR